ncbi:LysR family transcriptional regulator [Variovorax sp. OV329]|uniref:LysR family transcriptional regulator n=1 Tax=Variovorax sp. OV329 TaxID=1882825 RepID=UPI0008F251BC|nr:LysR family transcriptional regulator [Variovorax sp. OV329]SFN02332.1 DNA-binding transcriptional regulator, LysR family [Variovorax sp. OV329]
MHLELRHLRYFCAVARELSFSRAAEQLHIAQPPLSRQIRTLEEELGAELLDRSSRPLRLTTAGRYFQIQAQQMLDRMQEVQAATARIAGGRRTWYAIGFAPSTLYGKLPDVIRQFRQAHPTVELHLHEMTTVQQMEGLKAGRIDMGFGRLSFDDDDVVGELVRNEPVMVALPANHRLVKHKQITLAKLASEPLLLYPAKPRPSYADQVLEMFQSRGLKPTVALESNEVQTAIGLVVAGLGYALVPQSVQNLHREGVLYLPLGDEGVSTPVVMNRRRNDESELTAYLAEMVRALPSSVRSMARQAQA